MSENIHEGKAHEWSLLEYIGLGVILICLVVISAYLTYKLLIPYVRQRMVKAAVGLDLEAGKTFEYYKEEIEQGKICIVHGDCEVGGHDDCDGEHAEDSSKNNP